MPYSVSVLPNAMTVAWSDMTSDTQTGRDPVTYIKLEWN